jgi:hypothetical protein
MIQVHKFNIPAETAIANAAYVAHGLTFNRDFCKLKISVWFNASGDVIDCEGFDSLGRPRPVPEKVKKRLPTEWGYVLAVYRSQHRDTNS